MTIFIGADHRGLDLKNHLIEYLQNKNIRVEDMGAYEKDPEDDYPDFAQKVAQAVLQNPEEYKGIVVCGSGAGVCIAANRFKGIYCAVGFNEDHVRHMRENDHINVLSLAADITVKEKAERLIDTFINTEPVKKEKYQRRLDKVDQIISNDQFNK